MQILILTDHVCAKFSTVHESVMRVDGFGCNECPYSYNSANAFECKKTKTFEKKGKKECQITIYKNIFLFFTLIALGYLFLSLFII